VGTRAGLCGILGSEDLPVPRFESTDHPARSLVTMLAQLSPSTI